MKDCRFNLKKHYTLALFAVLLLLAFVFINIGSGLLFGQQKLDMTSNQRHTLSEASRQIVSAIEAPLYIRFYFSSGVSREYPAVYQYFQTVLRQLETFRQQNPKMIRIEVKDAEPYGKTAKEAQQHGLKSFLSTDGHSEFYFGAVFGNDNGDVRVIEQFVPERAEYLENDISRAISGLNNPLRSKIGITGANLPLLQKNDSGKYQEPAFLHLLRHEYELVNIPPQTAEIPYDIETLIVINPQPLSPLFAYALDQYLLRGGRLILFADVYAESEAKFYKRASENGEKINNLLKNWGVSIDFSHVVGDKNYGENLLTNSTNGEKIINFPIWLKLNSSGVNQQLSFTENLAFMRFHSAGAITLHSADNLKSTALFATTPRGGLVDVETVKLQNTQQIAELFAEKNQSFLLSVLLEGKTDSAYMHNPLEGTVFEQEMLPFLPTSIKDGKLLIVADSDFLDDSLWVDEQTGGEGVFDLISSAQNGEFLLRAVDYMTDAAANSRLGRKSLRPKSQSISAQIYQQKRRPYMAEYEQNERLLAEKEKLDEIWKQTIQDDAAGINMSVIRKLEQNRKEIKELQEKLQKTKYQAKAETAAQIDCIIWLNILAIPAGILLIIWLFCLFANRRRRRLAEEIMHEYKIY